MHTSFQHSRDRLLRHFLDFLWHQWSALGVAGQRDGDDDRIIDPEALLLATTRFGRYDSRLLDEVIDWLGSNGTRINLQRLRRLHDEWPVALLWRCQSPRYGGPQDPADIVACGGSHVTWSAAPFRRRTR